MTPGCRPMSRHDCAGVHLSSHEPDVDHASLSCAGAQRFVPTHTTIHAGGTHGPADDHDPGKRNGRTLRARHAAPGGQNVNKVSTAVELRFDVANSPSLPEPVRERLLAKRDRRITNDGVLVLNAQRFRTQERNRHDARERLAHFIDTGLHAPKPRIATRPTRGSKERRLGAKRERSTIKRGRGNDADWD